MNKEEIQAKLDSITEELAAISHEIVKYEEAIGITLVAVVSTVKDKAQIGIDYKLIKADDVEAMASGLEDVAKEMRASLKNTSNDSPNPSTVVDNMLNEVLSKRAEPKPEEKKPDENPPQGEAK